VACEPGDLADRIGPRTRAVSVSHVSSPTAPALPVEEICAAARAHGALAIVDGAHAPGQVPVDLEPDRHWELYRHHRTHTQLATAVCRLVGDRLLLFLLLRNKSQPALLSA